MKARRAVLVTGAGRGLGAAIARDLAADWFVGVLDRDRDTAEASASEIGSAAVALVADTTDEEAVEAALDHFATAAGVVPTGLVANAGIVRFGPLLDLALEDWRAVVEVNLTGTFVTARALAKRLATARRGGAVVAVTSMNGVVPGPNAGAYAASKAGVARLVQQMALEWGPLGIRVNAVAPGLVDIGMSEPIYADHEMRERRERAVPLGRLGRGDDVASVVRFLLSDSAQYVTGTELLVDGGVTMSVIATLPRPHAVDGVGGGVRAGGAAAPDGSA